MNTIYLLIAVNSKLGLKNLETNATLKIDAKELEKLIFTHIYFDMKVKLLEDTQREREKAEIICKMAQKIWPIRQSWEKTCQQTSSSPCSEKIQELSSQIQVVYRLISWNNGHLLFN